MNMVNKMFNKRSYHDDNEIQGRGILMFNANNNSAEDDLDMLANLAAKLLSVSAATITIYEQSADDNEVQAVAMSAIACDQAWMDNHSDIDLRELGNPRTAIAQHLEFYASVPLRNGHDTTIGMLACAGDKARELSDDELETMKHIAAIASKAAHI